MSKFAAIALIGFALLVVGGVFYFIGNSPSPASLPRAVVVSKPWVEVARGSVIGSTGSGGERPLKTGDEVDVGMSVFTSSDGLATIHFPDGSVLRVDSGTRVTIEEAAFDRKTETVQVRVRLTVGRVWSKILALVTPESVWEVKTSNAVATVRGTAFGTEYISGRSRIIGSENEVRVGVVDPATGIVVERAVAIVLPHTLVEINDERVSMIRKSPEIFAAVPLPDAIGKESWVRGNETTDEVFDQKIKELKGKGLEGRELREEFREIIGEEFFESMREEVNEEPQRSNDMSGVKGTDVGEASAETQRASESVAAPPKTKTSEPATVVAPVVRDAPGPVSLEIVSSRRLEGIKEGTRVSFKAVVVLSNGERRDVTTGVSWRVIGPIGSIERPGVFLAQLDQSVAEFGLGSGTVVAVWKDERNGAELLGKTPVFNVEPVIELLPDETRG